jgi:DNA-binding transcriptional ArsR family regulator
MRIVNISTIMQADDMLSQIEEHFHVVPLGEKSLDFGKILSSETSVKVLEVVYNSDTSVGVSATDISEALGVGRTTVIYHLGRMQESGLVTINPVLQSNDSWTCFWELYRRRNAEVSKEQFNQIHAARMNGVKLYVPTKKGFLVLPSTDVKESRSMVKDVLTSITGLAVERDYGRMKKTTSLLGTLGLLFVALSFAFQMPLFQSGLDVARAPVPLAGKSTFLMQDSALDSTSEISPPTTMTSPTPADSPRMEKSVSAATMEADSVDDGVAPEEGRGVEPGLFEEEKTPTTPMESEIAPSPAANRQTITAAATDEPFLVPRLLFYVGILLVGSFLGFLIYAFIRKK